MYPMAHVAAALLLKSRFASAPTPALFLAVLLPDILWFIFSFLGIESTTIVAGMVQVRYMPYSHSVASVVLFAGVAYAIIAWALQRPALGLAIALGIASNLPIDLITHFQDIPLLPRGSDVLLGFGLYSNPVLGFAIETAYCVLCWWVYKGSFELLAAVLFFNLIHIPLLPPAVGQPVPAGAGPMTTLVAVTLLAVETLLAAVLVWRFSSNPILSRSMGES